MGQLWIFPLDWDTHRKNNNALLMKLLDGNDAQQMYCQRRICMKQPSNDDRMKKFTEKLRITPYVTFYCSAIWNGTWPIFASARLVVLPLSSHIEREKEGTHKENEPLVIWDHEHDMSLGAWLMDDKQRQKMLRNVKGLGEHFSSGSSGGFL